MLGKIYSQKVVRNWNRLSSKMVESPSLELFQKMVDGALSGHDADGLTGRLLDLNGLFQPITLLFYKINEELSPNSYLWQWLHFMSRK